MTLADAPYLPKSDNWVYDKKYKVRVYKKQEGESGTVLRFEFAGAVFPATSIVNGLEANTEYCVFVEYCGLMKSTVQHNVLTSFKTLKTEESGEIRLIHLFPCINHHTAFYFFQLDCNILPNKTAYCIILQRRKLNECITYIDLEVGISACIIEEDSIKSLYSTTLIF